jgi:hypothetical protein
MTTLISDHQSILIRTLDLTKQLPRGCTDPGGFRTALLTTLPAVEVCCDALDLQEARRQVQTLIAEHGLRYVVLCAAGLFSDHAAQTLNEMRNDLNTVNGGLFEYGCGQSRTEAIASCLQLYELELLQRFGW